MQIVQIVEVLIWLGAACRASPTQNIAYCTPKIALTDRSDLVASITVSYGVNNGALVGAIDGGTCWHDMFHNPVIVQGYPVMARKD